MLALLEAGCRLCVPVIEGKGLPLTFREWTPGHADAAGTVRRAGARAMATGWSPTC